MVGERNSQERNLRHTTAEIGRAYWAFHDRTMESLRQNFLPWVNTNVLEAFETLAAKDPQSRVAAIHGEMMRKLTIAPLATDAAERDAFKHLYEEADRLVFPATTAFLRHAHALLNFTQNHSLAAINLETLRKYDVLGHSDTTYAAFIRDLAAKLGPNVKSPDVVAFSQFFEIYGEAVTFEFLRSRPGLTVGRIPETKTPTPDFRCVLDGGVEFYIEVKSLDIVGGAFRHDEIMRDGIDATIEIQRQKAAGQRVAFSETAVAPYQKIGDSNYDPRSLIRVIDTLREKCRSAFKGQQFGMGPTFALAVTDRLIIPGGRNALAPAYYDPFQLGACVSGVLWHAAYGTIGTPIFRPADFEGMPTLEGRLQTDGLYTDTHQPFPGLGLIVLSAEQGGRKAWGLSAGERRHGDWDSNKTDEVLQMISNEMNDQENRFAWRLSHGGEVEGAPA